MSDGRCPGLTVQDVVAGKYRVAMRTVQQKLLPRQKNDVLEHGFIVSVVLSVSSPSSNFSYFHRFSSPEAFRK